MNTHELVKLEYFDVVLTQLRNLAIAIDEECPHEYRTDALSASINNSFDLLNEVAHQHLLRSDGEDIPPIAL
jgi:hypothetical protein